MSDEHPTSSKPTKPRVPNSWVLTMALLSSFLLMQLWFGSTSVETIQYSEFEQLLDERHVDSVSVGPTWIEGLRTDTTPASRFRAVRVPPDIAARLGEADVDFAGRIESNWLSAILSWTVPILLLVWLWSLMMRRMGGSGGVGGLMGVGKSKAKVYVEHDTGVRFDDVAGVDEAKAELAEVVSFLEDRTTYGRLGAHVPRGILLVGPPGTGKTLLARAVAGEARVPFFSITGSEFVEMFVGVGAARVRDLFEQARKAAPCIIFVDELDALGRARSAFGGMGGHDEKEQTLNQLLAELDGFDPRAGIVLLAATNRPEVLDPALMRAGRFDRQVVVDRPDRQGRIAILKVHLKSVTIGDDAKPEDIAGMTTGFTGADLANLVNEAAIVATRRDASAVELADFNDAFERIVAGSERRGRVLDEQERRRVAWHEMGHALVAASLPGSDPVQKVSIIPRSIGALGYTLQRPTEDRFLITTGELKNRMTVLLAGRAAEKLVFDEVSTGAADDLVKVTDIARQIVTRFGMSDALGQAVLEPARQAFLEGQQSAALPRGRDYAEATAREVDLAVRDLIAHAYVRALEILTSRRIDLDTGARLLLEHETLTPEDYPPLRAAHKRQIERGETNPPSPESVGTLD